MNNKLKEIVKRSIEQNLTKQEFLMQGTEIMRETPRSRIRGQNSVKKEL